MLTVAALPRPPSAVGKYVTLYDVMTPLGMLGGDQLTDMASGDRVDGNTFKGADGAKEINHTQITYNKTITQYSCVYKYI